MFSSDLVIVEQLSRQILMVIVNTSLKGLLLILCVYFLLSIVKRTSSRTLHFIWFLSIAGFIVLPVLTFLTSSIQFGSIRIPENAGGVYQTISSVTSFNQSLDVVNPMASPLSNPIHSTVSLGSDTFIWTILFIIWLTGAVALFSRTLVGNARALKIIKHGYEAEESIQLSLLSSLQVKSRVRRPLSLMLSAETVSPFTLGVFRPVVVLPEYMKSWPAAEIEPVLIHELHHIKRKDYLTQTLAMVICALFWFVPPIWIALKKLYEEQEKACDAEVVRKGINPRHYINQMLKIACTLLHPEVSPGLFMINGRKRLFEIRIINILEKRGTIMKKRTLLLIGIGFTLVLALLAGCITTQKTISEEDFYTSWSGTWVNPDIEGSIWIPEKIVTHPDGGYDIFVYASDEINFCHHEIELIDQWTDAKGDIWYQAHGYCPSKGIEGYMYGKISNSGNTLEFKYNTTREPIDNVKPDESYDFYCKFTREG